MRYGEFEWRETCGPFASGGFSDVYVGHSRIGSPVAVKKLRGIDGANAGPMRLVSARDCIRDEGLQSC